MKIGSPCGQLEDIVLGWIHGLLRAVGAGMAVRQPRLNGECEMPRQRFRVRWKSCIAVALFSLWTVAPPAESLPSVGKSVRVADVNFSATSNLWRTGFHFQPKKNWMNDPNGPLYYKGYYHLFYQYDPYAALWGNITWGHAVSTDLIHWKYVDDDAIVGGPGWFDILGAWSGSATILKDGSPAILYTGWSNVSHIFQIQTQNLALPVNVSDPLLRRWYKSPHNPVIVAEPTMNASNFRDPTQGWKGKDGEWRILVGGEQPDGAGTAHVYKSKDFVDWKYVHDLHEVAGTGMWECPDFYPVALSGKNGLDISVNNALVKHVVKASINNLQRDLYSVGTYDEETDTFKADNPKIDVGLGLRYDYGKYYASKTFFDHKTNRRILFGWINESLSNQDAVADGWSGIQAIPRQVYLDPKTLIDLIQVPVEEVDGLHRDKVSKTEFTLKAGSVLPVSGVGGAQLDIHLKFYKPDLPKSELKFDGSNTAALDAQEICSQTGAAYRGYYGPFGVLVLADKDLREQTAVYFYVTFTKEGRWKGILCSDNSRSSLASGIDKTVFGTYIRVFKSDKYLTLRTLVDHSIVESFAQGGRTVITSRVYPTLAVGNDSHFYIFNNGTQEVKVHSFNAWKMENIDISQIS